MVNQKIISPSLSSLIFTHAFFIFCSLWHPSLVCLLFSYFFHLFVYVSLPSSNLPVSLCFSHEMSEIKIELDTLPMRTMLAGAFITYLSSAPEDRRRHCLETWMAQSGLRSAYALSYTFGKPE